MANEITKTERVRTIKIKKVVKDALDKFKIEKRKVSIGCRRMKVRAGAVGVDMHPPEWAETHPERFVRCDATSIPFPDGYFGEVYASHVFEHFKKGTRTAALTEWWRLVAPEGKMRIIVPNTWAYIRECYEGRWDMERLSDMMFGLQTNEHEHHYYGYDAELLPKFIKKVLGKNCIPEEVTFGRRGRFPIEDLEIRCNFIKKE